MTPFPSVSSFKHSPLPSFLISSTRKCCRGSSLQRGGCLFKVGLVWPGCLGRAGLEHRLEFLVLVWPYPFSYIHVPLLSPDGGREATKPTQLLQSCCLAESACLRTQVQRELHVGLVMPSEMAVPGKEGRDLPSEDDMPRGCYFRWQNQCQRSKVQWSCRE